MRQCAIRLRWRMAAPNKEGDNGQGREPTTTTTERPSAPLEPGELDQQALSNYRVTLHDLMDPYKYSLKRVTVKRDLAHESFGIKTAKLDTGVAVVSAVKNGGIADQYGVEVGMYPLCVNGRMYTGDEKDLQPNENGFRITLARKRRLQLNRQMPLAFLGRYQRQAGCEYFLTRVNFVERGASTISLVIGRGGKASIGVGSDRAVLNQFGLRIGDAIIAVEYCPTRDKFHCEALLRASRGDLIDLTIERAPVSFIPVIKVKVPDTFSAFADFSLSDDSNDSPATPAAGSAQAPSKSEDVGLGLEEEYVGDPSIGVPSIPPDVTRHVQGKARDLARKIVGPKLPSVRRVQPLPPPPTVHLHPSANDDQQSSSMSLSFEQPSQRVKLIKVAKTTKLKKPAPRPPPKK